ncbi:MAG: SMI1/KNR4 family protein [Streptomyces sp.]|uniref:SMI1/KNR4 family protein n=1 Tax=Streptomyces sp. TaxID=1931 RepID=UPI0025F2FBD4|nr:SMI1/KNR4 family protein [Streptomyces sp.]MBW8796313.1 SMI1/KNR4 family protein [Streptomyces sp.]
MTQTSEDWRPFLVRWSQEWADAQGGDATERDEEPLRTRWLGFPPAPEERIRELEERLGHRLPPSYRSFLAVTDGWRHAGGFLWVLAGTGQARWHEDAAGLSEYFPGELDDGPAPEDQLLAGMWGRALQLDVESDALYVLLDPGDVDGAGEWAVYTWAPWHAEPPTRYGSFRVFMAAMYREFHHLQVSRSERQGSVFVNATTRALDASVAAARLDALAGRYEQAAAALAEAVAFGRPRARGLHDQIRRLLGETYLVSFRGLAADPVYAPEIVPVLAAEHVRMRRDGGLAAHDLPGAADAVRATADEVLGQIREGTYRYTAEGPFGRAVEEARELARWGETDAAWHTLRAALPDWRPLSPEHLAPLGLCADPLLGPLITPDRGRELLATPRAGQPGATPPPTADLDPPGLAWLADETPGTFLTSYRFLLLEGVAPLALPSLIAPDADTDGPTALNAPAAPGDARMRFRAADTVPPWADTALAAVGRAGTGWSFAFEGRPGGGFDERRLVSPGLAASRDTRAVTVWSRPSRDHHPGVFYLSVAENGEERYGLTAVGTTTEHRGPVPEALRFPLDGPDEHRRHERRVLEALATEFGVRLPRFALAEGRLHTLRTRPWNRAPGPGESYLTVRLVPYRP